MKITNNNYLKKIEKQNTGASYLSRLPANNAGGLNVSAKPAAQSVVKNQPKDTWGAFGGALFVGEKLLTGLVSSFEGAVDYLGSGFAKLIGNDKWAEEIISEDWFGDWYSHPEEWFNPSDGWKIAGDVAGSIGTSIPALGIGIVTHGAALPTFAAAALPAAGRSTQEAYKKTGELGIQEFGYGLASGTVEGGLETVTNLIGMGTGTLIKSFSKSFAKEAGEAAVKEGLIKTVGKSFIGEAFEEGTSEFLDPYIKRATYDGQAENATPDQIIYSGIIGGLSGALMGGGGYGINTANSFIKGHKLTTKGGESEVFQTSDYILGKAQKDALDADIFKEIKDTREKLTLSLESTGGKVETVAQKKMLGDLSRSNIVGAMNMGVARRALNIVNNAPDIAKRLSAYGYKDTSGRAMTFTAEEITAGYDPKKPSSIYKALKENAQLRSLAVADAAGALMLDTSRFAHATMTGEVLAGKVDLNRFRETATPEEIKAVSEALKIDSWQGLTYESFAEKLTDYLKGGGVNRAIKTNELKASFKTAEPSQAFSDIPKGVFFNNDGVRRYTDGNIDIGISKEGDSYRIYDYHTDSLTNEMSKSDVNGILRSYNGEKLKVFEAARAQKAAIEEMQRQAAEIDTYARDNIKDYKKLSSPAQSQIRRIIEDGRAKGVSDSDVLAYAKIAAHSGLDFAFDKESNAIRNSKLEIRNDTSSSQLQSNYEPPSPQGEGLRYADGYYDASRNLVVINPEATRTAERLLIHELDHAIRKAYGNSKFKIRDSKFESTKKEIEQKYDKKEHNSEFFAYYSEKMLTNKHTLEKLIEAEPTLKEKILNFFKGASEDYADVPKLSGAAKRYYRTYKKLFDEFSARNAENNALEPNNNGFGSYNNVAGVSDNVRTTVDKYSYNALTKKKDLSVVTLSTVIPQTTDGKIDKKAIIAQGKLNARKQNNPNNTDTNTYVHIDDIGVDVLLGAKGLQHGLARSEETAFAVMKIGDILKESIAVNEMNGSAERKTDMSYVLLGACQDNANLYVVRSVVSKLENDVTEIDVYQLGAVKGKKTKTPNSALKRGAAVTEQSSLISSGSSTVSISDFMQYVKDIPLINEILSEDVAKKLGIQRSVGTLSSDLRYALDIESEKSGNRKYNALIKWVADNYIGKKDSSLEANNLRQAFFKLSEQANSKWFDASMSDKQVLRKLLDIAGEIMNDEFDTPNIYQIYNKSKGAKKSATSKKKAKTESVGNSSRRKENVVYSNDIERENVRLRAEWEGDTVFSENTVEETLYKKIEQFKYLKKGVRDEIIRDLWVGLEESRSAEERKTAEIMATNKIVEAIVLNPKSEVGMTEDGLSDRKQLTEKVIKVVSGIAKSGKLSERVKLEKKFAQQAKTKANAEKREAIAKKQAEITEKAKATIAEEKKKAEAKAQKTVERGRKALEAEKSRLKADYESDRVYNEKTVEDRLYDKVEQFKYLNKEIKERLVRELWFDLNESKGPEWRKAVEIEHTVKIVDEILHNPNSDYDFTNPSDRQRLNESVSKVISGIAKSGRLSKNVKLEKRLMQEAKTEANAKQRILNGIYQTLKKIDDKKKKRFMSASSYKSAEFGKTIETLTKMDWRGNFSTNIARGLMKELSGWYTADNPMIFPQKNDENSFSKATAEYNPAIAGRLKMLSEEGDGDYTVRELQALSDVISYFTKLVDEYDKVYLEGKWQDGEVEAKNIIKTVKKQEKIGLPAVVRGLRNKWLSFGFKTYGDPLSVMKLADMYGDGIFTKYYNEWMNGEINAEAEAKKIKTKYDEFMKANRKYLKGAETETVKLHGQDVLKIDLISYAMTLKREQAWESSANGGVVFIDPKDGNKVTLKPVKVDKSEGYKGIKAAIEAEQKAVMSMLSETDVEYMKILEEGFELAKVAKTMGDMQRLGFVNVIEGYYYPIRHAYPEHVSDFNAELISTDRYANASFNKSTTEEANSAILIRSADTTFNSHVKGVSRYLYLSPVMDSFNKLYKLKVGESSVQRTIEESKTAWRDNGKLVGFDYLQNLMLDTMGLGKSVGDDFFAKIRGGAVTFALGANPKVLVTQLSSIIASTNVLRWSSHVAGLKSWSGDMDKYSSVAALRNNDYTVAKAEGVVERINTWSRVFTAGISLMDRFVVYRAWAACQAEVARTGGPAVGTEANKIEAGKLLDKVILETQQNSFTSRRTEGARRGNVFVKSFQMYKSDSITNFGRAVDGWGEVHYLKALLKSDALDANERKTAEAKLGEAKKHLGKAIGAIAEQAIFMMLITEMFRGFYGKNDDETEEEKRTRLVVDGLGNLYSGIPILSEIHSTLTSNYGFDTMEYSALNDFFDTAKSAIDYASKAFDGTADKREGARFTQNLLYSAGQLIGVPTRNMKNLTYGVVRMFDKDSAYKWDNALYKKNYSADLNEAVAKGDIDRAMMIMELALGEKLGGGFKDGSIKELTRLAGLGEKVTPSAISDNITVNGEEYALDKDQYEAVKAKYNEVIAGVNSFTESRFYKALSDEQKAKALRKMYSTYKDIAYDTVLGTNRNDKALIMSKLLPENVFNAYLSLNVYESDKDREGKTIAGSKRAKVVKAIGELGVSAEERLLLICASGYTLKDGDIRGLSAEAAKRRLLKYILSLKGASAAEKAEIAEMCGFEVKNGKIVRSSVGNLPKLKI